MVSRVVGVGYVAGFAMLSTGAGVAFGYGWGLIVGGAALIVLSLTLALGDAKAKE